MHLSLLTREGIMSEWKPTCNLRIAQKKVKAFPCDTVSNFIQQEWKRRVGGAVETEWRSLPIVKIGERNP